MLRIKCELLRRGWNQVELAFRSKIPVSDISRIETGRLRPYRSQVERLSGVLEIDRDELLQDVAAESSLAELRTATDNPTPAAPFSEAV